MPHNDLNLAVWLLELFTPNTNPSLVLSVLLPKYVPKAEVEAPKTGESEFDPNQSHIQSHLNSIFNQVELGNSRSRLLFQLKAILL